MKWLDTLRKKDDQTKQKVAFVAALSLTLLIGGIYAAARFQLISFNTTNLAQEEEVQQKSADNLEKVEPFDLIRDGIASVISVIKEQTTGENNPFAKESFSKEGGVEIQEKEEEIPEVLPDGFVEESSTIILPE
jgi:hypothetical protein